MEVSTDSVTVTWPCLKLQELYSEVQLRNYGGEEPGITHCVLRGTELKNMKNPTHTTASICRAEQRHTNMHDIPCFPFHYKTTIIRSKSPTSTASTEEAVYTFVPSFRSQLVQGKLQPNNHPSRGTDVSNTE